MIATSILTLPQLGEAQARRAPAGRPVVGQAVPRPPIAAPPGRGYGYGYGHPYYPYRPAYGYPYYRYGYYPYAWGGWGYPYYPYGSFGFSIGFGFGYGYPVSFGVGFGYPGFYNPWYGYPYGPYPGAYPYAPYAYGGYLDDRTSALRIDGDKVEAEVYIDGYLAGRVDDYDGNLQRLYLRPGEHELTVYLDGYHTVRQQMYLNPGATKTLRFNMEPLGPGETSERPPAPVERERADPTQRIEPQDPVNRPYPRDPAPASRYGTLSLRVQPSDAEIVIDGERWSVTAGEARIAIQLSPGLHRLEIRKEGYEVYVEDISVRDGRLLPLNVSLKRKN